MAEEQLRYPQAYLAQGNGDLIQVTDFRITFANGAKLVHTLRRKGAGLTFGNPECTVSFNSAVDEDGPERNYWKAAQRGEIKQLRAKIPGGVTLTINGAYSGVDLDGPLDAETKTAKNFIGKLEDVDF